MAPHQRPEVFTFDFVDDTEVPSKEARDRSFDIQAPGITTRERSVFDSLPCILVWLVMRAATKGRTAVDAVCEAMNQDEAWLSGVVSEIKLCVPVGTMSRSIWSLSQALVRCLSQAKSPTTEALVADLMDRLIMEEDCSNFKVTPLIYSLAFRAAPNYAEPLFMTMTKRNKHNPQRSKPTTATRSALVVALTKLGQTDRAAKHLWKDAPIPLFNTILMSYDDPDGADKLLLYMESYLFPQSGRSPNVQSFRIVFQKWLGSGNLVRAESVLERQLVWSKSFEDLHPPVDFFVDLMRVQADSVERLEGLAKVLQIHLRRTPKALQSKPGYQMTYEPFEMRMVACSKQGNLNQERVGHILEDMLLRSIKPSPLCWALAVNAWTRVGRIDKAEKVLIRAGHEGDTIMWNLVLKAWCRTNVHRAQMHFDRFCRQGQRIRPNAHSFEVIFAAWKNSTSAKANYRTKHLLKQLEQQVQAGNVTPTFSLYELAVDALTNAKDKVQALKVCRQIQNSLSVSALQTPKSPTSVFYAFASHCNLNLMEELFRRMEKSQVTPTSVSFDCVVAAMSQPAILPRNIRTSPSRELSVPDVESCNSVLAVCLSNYSEQSSTIAQSMINNMIRVYKTGNTKMLPTPSSFIRLYAKLYVQRDNIDAKAALSLVQGLKFPDERFSLSCFQYGLTICAWSSDRDSPALAHELWKKLKTPSLDCLNLLLQTFANHARHDLAKQAEALFHEHADNTMSTNAESVNLVIQAVAKGRRRDSAQQAFHLLERFKPLVCDLTFGYVLVACAMTPVSDMGSRLFHYHLAQRALVNWKLAGNAVTSAHYHRLLTCAIRLAPTAKARVQMSKQTFRGCCDSGLLDELLLRRFWSAIPEEERIHVFRHKPSMKGVPSRWTRNVPKRPKMNGFSPSKESRFLYCI